MLNILTADPEDKSLTLNIPLKTEEEIEAVLNFFNDTIQWAGWNATPERTDAFKTYQCPILIKQKIIEKRRLHRSWHQLRTPESKRLFIAATQDSNNSSSASKHSDKALHLRNLLTNLCGRQSRK
jgi:hypothetical protein